MKLSSAQACATEERQRTDRGRQLSELIPYKNRISHKIRILNFLNFEPYPSSFVLLKRGFQIDLRSNPIIILQKFTRILSRHVVLCPSVGHRTPLSSAWSYHLQCGRVGPRQGRHRGKEEPQSRYLFSWQWLILSMLIRRRPNPILLFPLTQSLFRNV